MNIILPILLFGVLVTIHELGHFLTAKWAGVFVERFAIGFGPAIFRKKYGETEYALCLLPLGGYVKMRGEGEEMDTIQKSDAPHPTQEELKADPRAFPNLSVWKRIAIVAMGPIANLVLPIVVFTTVFMIGSPTPESRIGSVIPGYPAEKAGLRDGDLVKTVDGKPVKSWEDLTRALASKSNQTVNLEYTRGNQTLKVAVTPIEDEGPNMYGEVVKSGRIGIDFLPYRPTIGIPNPESTAAKLGLETGDIITAINDKKITHWWEINEILAQAGPKKLDMERPQGEGKLNYGVEVAADIASLEALGIETGDLYIKEVVKDSVAAERGLLAGDKLLSLNDKNLLSWNDFRRQIQTNQGENFKLKVLRKGKPITLDFIPKEVEQKDEFTHEKKKQRQLGVISAAVSSEPTLFTERYANPFKALYRGVQETVDISVATLGGLGRMVMGRLSLNSLGGPISIFSLAGTSYKVGGWAAFFRIMAILSISLGVLNFLPIPVLDGGHLFFFFIEAIKGSPVSMRVQKIGHNIGLAMVLTLMAVTFYVDINRFLVDKIKALF